MSLPIYPVGGITSLLGSEQVSLPTRKALLARMNQATISEPCFFDKRTFAILQAACARLMRPMDGEQTVDIAGPIDRLLADSAGNGWRYDALPPYAQAYQAGLHGLDQSAHALFDVSFVQLDAIQQDSVLCAVQCGKAPGVVWVTLPAQLFFEELLAAATQACYAHPLVQESIGYAGMADAPGWQLIGLNELQAREPRHIMRAG